MVGVCNTTPLNYLVLIGAVDILPQLFERVLVPQIVMDQLLDHRTPNVVRAWASHPPTWLGVVAVPAPPDPVLAKLHAGEREAIILAQKVGAAIFIVDERAARKEAERRGLNVTGTLGILDIAAQRGLIDFESAIERLRRTTFRMTESLLEQFLEREARPAPW